MRDLVARYVHSIAKRTMLNFHDHIHCAKSAIPVQKEVKILIMKILHILTRCPNVFMDTQNSHESFNRCPNQYLLQGKCLKSLFGVITLLVALFTK